MTEQQPKTIYDFVVTDNKGEDFNFKDLEGKVIMIVNTASKCGFTPQYKELQTLYDKYKDQGFVVVGFPCNQFLSQEPGTDEEIMQFCSLNYGVTFPIMKKIDVNGEHEHPLYKFLKSQKGGWFTNGIKWNFTKFLINKTCTKIERYSPTTNPLSIEKDIITFLSE